MKKFLTGLVLLSSLAGNVNADFIDGEDDTYIGLQMTIPLASKSSGPYSNQNQYSFFVVEQKNGARDGVVITQLGNSDKTLNYLWPSSDFEIGASSISEYALPLVKFSNQGELATIY